MGYDVSLKRLFLCCGWREQDSSTREEMEKMRKRECADSRGYHSGPRCRIQRKQGRWAGMRAWGRW